jgi:hypothetical protein
MVNEDVRSSRKVETDPEESILTPEHERSAEAFTKLYEQDMMNNPAMVKDTVGSIKPGQRVEFDIVRTPNGSRAVNVRPL